MVGALVGDRRQELVQEIAVRAVHFERIDAEPLGAFGGRDEGLARRAPGPSHRARAAPPRPPCAAPRMAPRSASRLRRIGICCPPSHGTWLDPLRPAWASCIATAILECLRTEARIGFSAASVASFHRPRQPGVMRPIASTWVASMQNIAAPDSASVLICVKCQSLASPFSAEYWHIGATMMRLGSRKVAQLDRRKQGAHGGYPGGREGVCLYLTRRCIFLNARNRERRGAFIAELAVTALLLDAGGLDHFEVGRGLALDEFVHLAPASSAWLRRRAFSGSSCIAGSVSTLTPAA